MGWGHKHLRLCLAEWSNPNLNPTAALPDPRIPQQNRERTIHIFANVVRYDSVENQPIPGCPLFFNSDFP